LLGGAEGRAELRWRRHGNEAALAAGAASYCEATQKGRAVTLEALWRGDWPAVVAQHDPASADPAAWLRLAIARWQQGETGNDALERALALGAEASDAHGAAITAAQLSLGLGLLLAGLEQQGFKLLELALPEWVPSAERPERARLLACNRLVAMGAWKQAEALRGRQFMPDRRVDNRTIRAWFNAQPWDGIKGAAEGIVGCLEQTAWLDATKQWHEARANGGDEQLLRSLGDVIWEVMQCSFLPNSNASWARTYGELNWLREECGETGAGTMEAFEASAILHVATPLVLLNNAKASRDELNRCPFWIANGNVRTGSTMVFNLLRILAYSLVDSVLCTWEGDLASPVKFFEIIGESTGIDARVLKIHRYHKAVNDRLDQDEAKAVLTHRNMKDACHSYWRMLNNPNSPFHRDNPSMALLEQFVKGEIEAFRAKAKQPNTLLIREDELRLGTESVISKIGNFLGLSIHASSLKFLGRYLSPSGMRALANINASALNSTGHERITYLHVDHIAPENSPGQREQEIEHDI
jgi:hypothetical protein